MASSPGHSILCGPSPLGALAHARAVRWPTSSAKSGARAVAIIYFDSSALAKRVVEEAGSERAAELWDGCDAAVASRVTYPEVRAALAAAGRNHDLDQPGQAVAESAWEEYWSATRPVELTRAVEQRSGQLASPHALRDADAVHLAIALALTDPRLTLPAWEPTLRAGAQATGL